MTDHEAVVVKEPHDVDKLLEIYGQAVGGEAGYPKEECEWGGPETRTTYVWKLDLQPVTGVA